VELLLAYLADLNAKDGLGRTALDIAVSRHETDLADLLRHYEGPR
jgi:ankyrin repeat protein